MGGYDARIDVWATGIFAFLLLIGILPFDGRFVEDFKAKVGDGFRDFPADAENDAALTDNAKAFVRACLTQDFRSRPSAVEALEHPWLVVSALTAGRRSSCTKLASTLLGRS